MTDRDGDGLAEKREVLYTGFGYLDTHGGSSSYHLLDRRLDLRHPRLPQPQRSPRPQRQRHRRRQRQHLPLPPRRLRLRNLHPRPDQPLRPRLRSARQSLQRRLATRSPSTCSSAAATTKASASSTTASASPRASPTTTTAPPPSPASPTTPPTTSPRNTATTSSSATPSPSASTATRLEWHGSTPKAIRQPDFLTCDDPWFRPVDVKLGPDGALYIADFYNPIIGHYEVPLTDPAPRPHARPHLARRLSR